MPDVNPNILVWARESAGLAPEDAARKLDLNSNKKMTAVEKLAAYEKGVLSPSRPLLLKMSQQYRRPLVAFYMNDVPKPSARAEDFRNIPDRDPTSDVLISTLVRNVRAAQATIKDVLLEEEFAPLDFVGASTLRNGADAVLKSIVDVTGIKIEEYRSKSSIDNAFAYLRAKAETSGVFVLLMGSLGSHHTAIDAEAFRGFALADKIAPFVVINDQDHRAAWSFTLLHELAHVWLGASGISGKVSDVETEKFCNIVANKFFLSDAELTNFAIPADATVQEKAKLIADFARDRHVSGSMVAFALWRREELATSEWRSITRFFADQWRRGRDAQKERDKETTGGPSYYVVRRHKLGRALLSTVSRAMSDGSLSPTQASQVLGVKPRSVSPLLTDSPPRGRAA